MCPSTVLEAGDLRLDPSRALRRIGNPYHLDAWLHLVSLRGAQMLEDLEAPTFARIARDEAPRECFGVDRQLELLLEGAGV